MQIPDTPLLVTPPDVQQAADRMIDSARMGYIRSIARIVAVDSDISLYMLSIPHSQTGDTVLHAAIQNGHVMVVGAITNLLARIESAPSASLRTLLEQKNRENHTPLEVGGLTPEIKTELLAGLSDLWPFCAVHKGYTVFLSQRKCGCQVCSLCLNSVQRDKSSRKRCTVCSRYLQTRQAEPCYSKIDQTRRIIERYSVLFEGENIPVCPNCTKLAFPPFKARCGHVLCHTCTLQSGETCRARIDDSERSGQNRRSRWDCMLRYACMPRSDEARQVEENDSDRICRQALEPACIDEAASRQFTRLFFSRTQYSNKSSVDYLVRYALNEAKMQSKSTP